MLTAIPMKLLMSFIAMCHFLPHMVMIRIVGRVVTYMDLIGLTWLQMVYVMKLSYYVNLTNDCVPIPMTAYWLMRRKRRVLF